MCTCVLGTSISGSVMALYVCVTLRGSQRRVYVCVCVSVSSGSSCRCEGRERCHRASRYTCLRGKGSSQVCAHLHAVSQLHQHVSLTPFPSFQLIQVPVSSVRGEQPEGVGGSRAVPPAPAPGGLGGSSKKAQSQGAKSEKGNTEPTPCACFPESAWIPGMGWGHGGAPPA